MILGHEDTMYGLIGKITTVAGQRDALLEILLGLKSMPGCVHYVIAKDPREQDVIWITEVWDRQESHAASLQMPAVREAVARAKPMIASFGDRIVTEPVGGIGLGPG